MGNMFSKPPRTSPAPLTQQIYTQASPPQNLLLLTFLFLLLAPLFQVLGLKTPAMTK